MHRSHTFVPAKSVAFASLLCLLMLGGEVISAGAVNPMALPFYCFLPAALWMMSADQKRSAEAIESLTGRVHDLEEALQRVAPLPRD